MRKCWIEISETQWHLLKSHENSGPPGYRATFQDVIHAAITAGLMDPVKLRKVIASQQEVKAL